MEGLKKLLLLQLLFLIKISASQEINYCGGIRIEAPLFHQNSSSSSFLSHMILCKSEKLYFKTSIGLFQVSSIDYTDKYLNCSNLTESKLRFSPCTDTRLSGCFSSLAKGLYSCAIIDDVERLETRFHPKQMNCTHYSRVYKSVDRFELGTRVSFDIPDHVPNPCDECDRPNGNCGVGLRCVCHPMKCKDKVISEGAVLRPCGNMLLCLVFFIFMVGIFRGF